MGSGQKTAAALGAVALVVAAWWGWSALHRAERALDAGEANVRATETVPYQRARLAAPAAPVEPLPSAPDWRDAARFSGGLYLLGPATLSRYTPEGELERVYRVGAELPAAELVSLAVGLDPRSGERSLFVATGAGWLIVAADGAVDHALPGPPGPRRVTALLPLADGRLLVGTLRDGVLVDDGETLAPLHPELADIPVTALAGDAGDLWIGTRDRGLRRLAAGSLSSVELADPQVLSLAVSGDAVYAGGPVGVAEIRDGRLARNLADGFFAAALAVQDDTLHVGALDEGVVAVPLGALRPGRAPTPPEEGPAPAHRLLDADGALYAVSPAGLYEKRPGGPWREAIAAPPDALSARNVSALRVDSAGKLWIGYFDRGLDVLADPSAAPLHVENERVFCVNRIVEDPARDRMLVATANGLVAFDTTGRERETLRRDDGLLADHVTDVLASEQGLTVATGAGLTFLDAAGARGLYAFHGLVNNHVYTLAERDGRVLAGTLGGLSFIQGGVVRESLTVAGSGLAHNWITAAVAAPGGGWWLATYGGGVQRLGPEGGFRSWAELAGVEINPNALLVSGERVFAGSLDRGLLVYDPTADRWTPWTRGLPSRNVTALERMGDTIIIGTDNGLVRAPLTLFEQP